MKSVYKVSEYDIQDAKCCSYSIGDSPRNPAGLSISTPVDNKLVWWALGSRNSSIIITFAKELFKGQSFETYQESAWLISDDAFIAIKPDRNHEFLYIQGFSVPFADSKENIWVTGQYNAFRSEYDAYLKYYKN